MFKAGSNLKDKSPEEIFYQDYKVFSSENLKFGIGQITAFNSTMLDAVKPRILKYMESIYNQNEADMLFFMLTNIFKESTELLYYGKNSEELLEKAFKLDEVSGGSINLPGVAVSLPALTEKDEADLRWAIRTGADIIAMSFVRFATDIDRAHEIMDEEGRRIPIIAKIEKPQALENLEEIVKTFDGVMAARGDMAVECPLEEVPLATKRCIELARQYAKPVIVATEVLGSMVNSPVPTRAEASDCANAILDGADATMTSNETAVGKYPAVTVSTMSRISSFATEHGFDRIPELKNLDMSSTGAVSSAAVDLADKLNAKAIVAYTQTGSTVHRVSRERPATPIYGITNNEHTYHWLALSWGTESFLLDEDYHDKSRKDLMIFTDKILKDAGKVTDGDKIVVLSSAQGEHQPGRTDSIYVHTVGACD